MDYGFVRVASAVPVLKVADCRYNADEIISLIRKAAENNVELAAFPELSVTGCTCGDIFFQEVLLDSAMEALARIAEETRTWDIVSVVGLPVRTGSAVCDCAAVLYGGAVCGIVPRTSFGGSGACGRWFSPGKEIPEGFRSRYFKDPVPFSPDLVFRAGKMKFAVVFGDDLFSMRPAAADLSVKGADLILNLSSSTARVGRKETLANMLAAHSRTMESACLYTSAGTGESSTDAVYPGYSFLYECGKELFAGPLYATEDALCYSEVDVELIRYRRLRNTLYREACPSVSAGTEVSIDTENTMQYVPVRKFDRNPFLPGNGDIPARCQEILSIQSMGLMKRLKHTGLKKVVVGISGGLDSTLALLVAVKAFDLAGLDRKGIVAVTMPGFGTTGRTYDNALGLMRLLGVEVREISIKEACRVHFADIGHDISVHDVTYENGQARERTQILMDVANMEAALVVGTGDLSELALGWATYNGDHMSMYSVNGGVPKTVVKRMVVWYAENAADPAVAAVLSDIVDTPISPELIPSGKEGDIGQKTEDLVGPYDLHDFYLYYFMECGYSPAKIYYLAKILFDGIYDKKTLLKWLRNFFRRFFSQQFKRNCLPDGPGVGSVSLASREDWRMPSDAVSASWMNVMDSLDE